VVVIADPYEPGGYDGAIAYAPICDRADIVLVSHDHADHNFARGIEGAHEDVRREGTYDIRGVTITAMPTFKDGSGGCEWGRNLLFLIEAVGLRLVHLGDLGHLLERGTVERIGKVDVLMIPVGGYFTIDAGEAAKVTDELKPLVTIPMHYKTEKVAFPITGTAEFTRGRERVRIIDGTDMEITRESMPKEPEIVLLRHVG
jgi:L-ascorbate metabolism protein UlaG (beta-lactamase superfamily)